MNTKKVKILHIDRMETTCICEKILAAKNYIKLVWQN